MIDLHQLPSPPGCGEVTACECEGVLRSHDPDTAAQLAQNMVCYMFVVGYFFLIKVKIVEYSFLIKAKI